MGRRKIGKRGSGSFRGPQERNKDLQRKTKSSSNQSAKLRLSSLDSRWIQVERGISSNEQLGEDEMVVDEPFSLTELSSSTTSPTNSNFQPEPVLHEHKSPKLSYTRKSRLVSLILFCILGLIAPFKGIYK